MNNYKDENSLLYLFQEIEKQINAKNFYSALFMSLSIPDALGEIVYPDLKCSSKRYIKWFDNYVKDYFGLLPNDDFYKNMTTPKMDGRVCFQLRCSMYHEGSNDVENKTRINEFVLSMDDSPVVYGKHSGNEALVDYETGSVKEIKYLYISCKGLALQILKAAKLFVENNPDLKYPIIRVNSRGGRVIFN